MTGPAVEDPLLPAGGLLRPGHALLGSLRRPFLGHRAVAALAAHERLSVSLKYENFRKVETPQVMQKPGYNTQAGVVPTPSDPNLSGVDVPGLPDNWNSMSYADFRRSDTNGLSAWIDFKADDHWNLRTGYSHLEYEVDALFSGNLGMANNDTFLQGRRVRRQIYTNRDDTVEVQARRQVRVRRYEPAPAPRRASTSTAVSTTGPRRRPTTRRSAATPPRRRCRCGTCAIPPPGTATSRFRSPRSPRARRTRPRATWTSPSTAADLRLLRRPAARARRLAPDLDGEPARRPPDRPAQPHHPRRARSRPSTVCSTSSRRTLALFASYAESFVPGSRRSSQSRRDDDARRADEGQGYDIGHQGRPVRRPRLRHAHLLRHPQQEHRQRSRRTRPHRPVGR